MKLPRLSVNWLSQPELFKRYWDQVLTYLENIGAFTGLISGGPGIDFDPGTGVIELDTTSTRNTDHAGVTLTAGAGLTGGGDITASRTFNVGAGTGIVVAADSVSVSTKLAAYDGGDTPSAFTLGIVDSVDAAAWRTAIGAGTSSTTGTVTSVAMTVPTGFSVTGSPITTSGTLALSYSAGYQGYTTAEATKLAGVAPGATDNTGTVTSVAASGGTTGLTWTGSPITTSGTLTLGGTLALANGGTGATTQAGARTNLGLGTAATVNTGTSGATIPLLNAANTFSNTTNFSQIVTGSGVTTGGAAIELGALRTGDGVSFIDFHGTSGTDYEARIIRNGGTNGSFQIGNLGSGGIEIFVGGTTHLTFASTNLISVGGTVGFSIGRTGVGASPAAADGNVLSGTYTPTLTGVANTTTATAYTCQFFRVGNCVTVSGKMDLAPTAGATLTRVGISLPVASNLDAQQRCAGTAAEATNAVSYPGAILGDSVNDRAELNIYSATTTTRGIFFTFTYYIL